MLQEADKANADIQRLGQKIMEACKEEILKASKTRETAKNAAQDRLKQCGICLNSAILTQSAPSVETEPGSYEGGSGTERV